MNIPRPSDFAILDLEFGVVNPGSDLRVTMHEILENLPSSLDLIVSELEFDVGEPGLLVRRPSHPPLEDVSSTGDISDHLFHVEVLVQQQVHSRKDRDGTVPLPHVARVVDELLVNLELGVLEPQSVVPMLDSEGSFPQRSSSIDVSLRLFPWSVVDPNGDVPSRSFDLFLELLALAEAVIGGVGDFGLRRIDLRRVLEVTSLPEDLFGGDLNIRRSFVPDTSLSLEFDSVASQSPRVSVGFPSLSFTILLFFA